jgi:hypothetical protein
MCFKKQISVPNPIITGSTIEVYGETYPIFSVLGSMVKQELEQAGVELVRPPLDREQDYYFTTLEGWNALLIYIYKDFNWPPYMASRMDCEDFSILFKGLVSAHFGLNYFAITIGRNGEGTGHAFNTFRIKNGELIDFEPQTAQVVTDYKRVEAFL